MLFIILQQLQLDLVLLIYAGMAAVTARGVGGPTRVAARTHLLLTDLRLGTDTVEVSVTFGTALPTADQTIILG